MSTYVMSTTVSHIYNITVKEIYGFIYKQKLTAMQQ